VVATLAIFTPIYLAVVIPGRWFLRHRDNRQVKAFVAGATAAGAGALAGAVVVLTRQAVTDWPTAAIALVTLVLLWRFKVPEPAIVGVVARSGCSSTDYTMGWLPRGPQKGRDGSVRDRPHPGPGGCAATAGGSSRVRSTAVVLAAVACTRPKRVSSWRAPPSRTLIELLAAFRQVDALVFDQAHLVG